MCPVVQPKEKKATDGGREGLCDLSFGGGQVGRAKQEGRQGRSMVATVVALIGEAVTTQTHRHPANSLRMTNL